MNKDEISIFLGITSLIKRQIVRLFVFQWYRHEQQQKFRNWKLAVNAPGVPDGFSNSFFRQNEAFAGKMLFFLLLLISVCKYGCPEFKCENFERVQGAGYIKEKKSKGPVWKFHLKLYIHRCFFGSSNFSQMLTLSDQSIFPFLLISEFA